MDYRAEAIEKLKENGISMTSMEVYIQGYIDGRSKTLAEDIPINTLWIKNPNGTITKTTTIGENNV